MKGYQELPDNRTQFRTEGDYVIATQWIGGKPVRELARIWRVLIEPAGSDECYEWVDLVCQRTMVVLARSSGEPALEFRRRKPDYTGED